MGRLFWKFFVFLWVGQLATTISVGVVIWFVKPEPGGFGGPPPHPELIFGTERQHFAPPGGALSRPPPAPGHQFTAPILPLIAGSLVSLVFAVLLAWYFSRPIRHIGSAFDSISNGLLDTRISAEMGRRNDELSDLGKGFDAMADRLQGLIEGQQRLLHDVSHELRSPLARLQAVSDLMQQQPERSAEFVTRIERETQRMDGLVGELLTLARLDAGVMTGHAVSLDLNEMIDAIAEDVRIEAQFKRCVIQIEMPEDIVVQGNSELLHRALENIVRNALQYSPEGGQIVIRCRTQHQGQLLSIEVLDQGCGVPEADLDVLFDVFFRSAKSGQTQGYGLGLSIAQRVVQAHNGQIKARNREQGGLAVSIELPLSATEDSVDS